MVVVKCCERGVVVVRRRVVGGTSGVVGRRVMVVKVVLADLTEFAEDALVKVVFTVALDFAVNLVWVDSAVKRVPVDPASLLAPPRSPCLGLPFWESTSSGILITGSR